MDVFYTVILIVLGGLLASFSGIFGYRVQAGYARKKRFEELIAEKRFSVIPELYAKLKRTDGLLIQGGPKEVKDEIMTNEEWYWQHRLFFPGNISQNWVELRTVLMQFELTMHHDKYDVERQKELQSQAELLLKQSLGEVIDEMKSSPLKGELKRTFVE